MRRAITLLLLFLVPLQYGWAAASLHLHPGEMVAGGLLHIGGELATPDGSGPGPEADGGPADGDHGHHCDHAPTLIIPDCSLPAGITLSDQPVPALAGVHASHIPPVRDRPPRNAG